MKNKKYIVILLSVLLLSFFVVPFIPVKADSGWDTDYGSSSSSSSSSGGYSSYDHSSSHSSSRGSHYSDEPMSKDELELQKKLLIFGFISLVPLCVLIMVISDCINSFLDKAMHEVVLLKKSKVGDYDKEVKKYFPEDTEKSLLDKLYQQFIDIQMAWMEFDYDKLKELCTDELYEAYRSDLEVLKLKGRKNVMSDFKLLDYNIRYIEKKKNLVVVHMALIVGFHDYVINTDTGEVTRGEKDTLCKMPYDLEFIYDMEDAHICPNCGAEMTDRECSFCHTIVSERRGRLVLNKKGLMKY